MRNRLTMTAAVLLLSSHVGMAQTPQQTPAPTPAPAAIPTLGSVDFGFRGTTTDDDEARYERYRDDRTGAYSRFVIGKDTSSYVFNATAFNVGYRNQRYTVDYDRSKLNFSFLWDSIPLNFSYLTLTPWNGVGTANLTLDDAAQSAVEAKERVGVPCAPGGPPATCNNPTNAQLALLNRSVYNTLLDPLDLQVKRDTAAFAATYNAPRNVDVHLSFTTTKKGGEMPWGASFAFNNANEVPLAIDNRTNDFSANAEWANAKGLVRLGWDGSWFSNDMQTLVWDNPIRLTDFNNGRTPPDGPWDPSGYSNGNGPAQGRMALWPSNNMNVVSVTGLYKMPYRSSVNGTLQFTNQNQDEPLIPWTINEVIGPDIFHLPRTTADASADGLNALINFSSRPTRMFGFQARYRYNDRDVQTPEFDAREYVRFDAVPEEIEEGFSVQYDVNRQNLDLNGTVSLAQAGSVRVGYGLEKYDREGRGFSKTTEHVFRASYDALALRYLSVRAAYDYGQRRGDGFILAGIDYEEGPGGTQPGLRYYDEADRNRSRGSLLFTLNPIDIAAVYFSFAGGSDEYLGDESIPEGREQFGLLDADVTSWNVGASVNPSDKVGFGANYGRDSYSSLQKSRNANPPPDVSWFDPTRDWTVDNDEDVNNFNVYVDLLKVFARTDVRVSYDFSDSDNAFVHGGPRIDQLNTNTSVTGSPPCPSGVSDCFIPLPNVTNTWHRLMADAKYFFTERAGIGLGYYFEKLDVEDFATIDVPGPNGFFAQTGDPRVDYLGGLITGYGARPYSGSTFLLRLLYLF